MEFKDLQERMPNARGVEYQSPRFEIIGILEPLIMLIQYRPIWWLAADDIPPLPLTGALYPSVSSMVCGRLCPVSARPNIV
jgi:hypothetical protein